VLSRLLSECNDRDGLNRVATAKNILLPTQRIY
jgi:hypothetical protein